MIAAVLVATLLVATPGVAEARYDAVIPQLDAWAFTTTEAVAYALTADAPLYDAPGGTVVATLAQRDFLGSPTVAIAVDHVAGWSRVLTPARKTLPSASSTPAAQTSAWVRDALLVSPVSLDSSIVISVSAHTLSIVRAGTVTDTFPVGVGTAGTPTPTGVTGYLEERYLDPGQGQDRYRVQLTSLHSTASDEPFGGTDGGLIGLHYEKQSSGAVSHGCVRLTVAALRAVDALPLGTLVSLVP